MSNVYLSRFRSQNFRSFGVVDVALPPRAGLVVLEGPNGLGKTSWMEALEWGLSGMVHRWQKQDGDHGISTAEWIRRRGANDEEPCSLGFDFGERSVEWTEKKGSPGTPSPAPATWLCGEPARWSLRPENLNGFLRATHILPQASSLRLLHFGAEERWTQVLRVVSGYSEIDDLSISLTGARPQLTIQRNSQVSAVDTAKQKLKVWSQRVETAMSKRSRAAAAKGLVPPSQVRLNLSAEEPLAVLDTEDGARDLTDWLGKRLSLQRSELVALDARRLSLSQLTGVPARWEAAVAAVEEATKNVNTHERDVLRRNEELSERASAAEATELQLATASTEEDLRRRRLDDLARLSEALPALRLDMDALVLARDSAARAMSSVALAIEHREQVRAVADHRRAYEARLGAYHRRVAACEAAAAAWSRVREILPRRDSIVQAADSLAASVSDALKAREAAKAALLERAEATKRARELANAVRAAAGEVQDLVASLARHIHDDSDKCLLCLAPYPALGSLRAQAEKATQEQGPAIAQAEAALFDAAGHEAAALASAKQADQVHTDAEQALVANQRGLGILDQAVAELRGKMTGVRQGHEDDDLAALREALAVEGASLTILPGAAAEPSSVLSVHLDRAEEEVRTAEAIAGAARATVEQTENKIAGLKARVLNLRNTLQLAEDDGMEAQLTSARAESSAATEVVRLAKNAFTTALAGREQARAAHSEAIAATGVARAVRDQRRSEQNDLERRWTGLKLDSPPNTERLSAAVKAAEERKSMVDARILALVAADEELQRWLNHAALDAEEEALDIEAGGSGPEGWKARTQQLTVQLGDAEAALEYATEVQTHIQRMANIASRKRASMRTELEARLHPILSPMLRSLIVDRHIADATISLVESRNRTNMQTTVGKDRADLLALASEGQLSGVNLTVQLSMALAFRWSRWPAVLLDDPAQYSDVVHSTNLIETLRVLALHHGFQVFLATHERDFALYVERKFRNDGLPTTRVMFREPWEPAKGVVPRVATR